MIFENIFDLKKAYTEGIYADTPANRKLGRVGMSYNKLKSEDKKIDSFKSKYGITYEEYFKELLNDKRIGFYLRNSLEKTTSYKKAAINYYSNYGYLTINRVLAREGSNPMVEMFSHFIDEGLKEMPKNKKTIYRGVSVNNNSLNNFIIGNTISFKEYQSYSQNLSIAKNALLNRTQKGNNIIFVTKNVGRDISSIAANPDEKEVLIERNSQFKIDKIIKKKDYTYIYITKL
jgi:hypothetical protein